MEGDKGVKIAKMAQPVDRQGSDDNLLRSRFCVLEEPKKVGANPPKILHIREKISSEGLPGRLGWTCRIFENGVRIWRYEKNEDAETEQ
jgi:hypothetical protein